MQLNIKKATNDNAESISTIWEIVCAERIYTAVKRPFSTQQVQEYLSSLSSREGTFVAKMDDQVVGFQSIDLWAKYTDSFDHVGVLGTFILPEWRGKGISRRLAAHTFEFAREHQYEKLIIYVRASNATAQAFYKSLGFKQKGVLSRQVKIDGKYDDEIFMELFL